MDTAHDHTVAADRTDHAGQRHRPTSGTPQGQKVSFDVTQGQKGLQAENIVPV